MRVRFTVILVIVAASLWLGLGEGNAEEKRSYSKGDKVRVKYVGEIVTGTVTSTKISGSLEVEFDWKGKLLSKSFPLTLVEGLVDPTAAAPTKASPKPTPSMKPASKKPAPAKPAQGKSGSKSTKAKPPAKKSKATSDAEAESDEMAVEADAGEGQEMRTWTSMDGRATIKARFVSYAGDTVTLIKEDGKKIKLSIHKLQPEDQIVAMQLSQAALLKNPPQPNGLMPSGGPGGPTEGSAQTVLASPQDWTGVRELPSSAEPPVDFQLEPDVAVEEKLEVMEGPYVFASRKASQKGPQIEFGVSDVMTRLMIDPVSNQAIVVLRSQWGAEAPVIRVVRIDLKDGQTTAQPFPYSADLRAYHAPTRRFLGNTSRSVNPFDQSLKQHLFGGWTEGEQAFEQIGAWPYEREVNPISSELSTLLFAGPNSAILWCNDQTVKVWDLESQRPQYVYKTSEYHGRPPTLSPRGRYLALNGNDEYTHIIEVASGNLLGKLPIKALDVVAFDPQGKYIAGATNDRVVVYDLQAGKLHRDLYLAQKLNSLSSDLSLIWLSEGYLLANHSSLVDVERATVLWHYEMPQVNSEKTQSAFYGGEFWYLLASDDDQQLGLFHATIPHQEALDAASQIEDSAMVLSPGAKIQLALSLSTVPEEEQAKIKQSLTQMIEAHKMVVDDSSTLVLTATAVRGEPVQQTYEFRNAPSQTATATPIALAATLADNGESVWKTEGQTGGLPGVLELAAGQSAQSYVDANCKPEYHFFHDLKIPPRLAKSPPGGVYGHSSLTKNGIEKFDPAKMIIRRKR